VSDVGCAPQEALQSVGGRGEGLCFVKPLLAVQGKKSSSASESASMIAGQNSSSALESASQRFEP